MYTEENMRGRFPLRDILLKAIVVIIFIILIIFIISRVTSTNNTTNSTSSNYDEVFNENLKAMEDAAFIYFTKDRLPTEVSSYNELTLREMINNNLLDAFTDADGNSCDVDESYIRLTKNSDDYTLRVNLKCNEKEDYSLTRVGEYEYCENDICERQKDKETTDNEEDSSDDTTSEVDITDNSGTSYNYSNSSNFTGTTNNSSQDNSSGSTSNNTVTIMYEYRKVVDPVLSSWSSWSSWDYNNNGYYAIKCDNSDANCLREVQLYSRREKVGVDTTTGKDVYDTVNYYSVRTRTLISSGSTDTRWSTYDDTNLLNQGYTYTGNTR